MTTRRSIRIVCYLSVLVVSLLASSISLAQTISPESINDWENSTIPKERRFESFEAYYLQFIASEPKKIIASSKVHYSFAKKVHSQSEMAKAANNMASAYCQLGEFDSGMEQFKVSIKLAIELKDTLAIAANTSNLGSIHYYLGNYKEAVKNYSKSLSLYRKKGVQSQQGEILNNLGLVFYEINNYELALNYFHSANKLYDQLESTENKGNLWINIANVQLKKGNYQKVLHYLSKAQPILEKTNNQLGIAESFYTRAKVFQLQGKTELATEQARKALRKFEEIQNPLNSASAKILLANLLLLSDYKTATKMAEETLPIAISEGDFQLKMDMYLLLSNCYGAQNSDAKALAMLKKHLSYRDSLANEEDNLTVIREAIQGEYSFRLAQDRLKHQKIQSNLKISQVKRTYAIVFGALLIIILLFVYFRSKISKDRAIRNQLLQELEHLKSLQHETAQNDASPTTGFQLNREKIEKAITRELNETDWNILNFLLEDPVISNKDLAEKIFLSVDGTGSALRRMYEHFEIKESKYKKISLLLEAVKLSN